ncbi:MAG: phosphatidate cytidylyltransferase [Chloroflexota bacterium]|nr:phosphatidate cytidylyltransferase [Chloroflexota bacterium]MDP6508295.1 phosphatidate cytidylyltransferase [Chloroflexota bacterium]
MATARRNLLLRAATVAVLLPVALLAVWAGNPTLLILTALMVLLGTWEMRAIANGTGWGFVAWIALPLALLLVPAPVVELTAAIVLLAVAAGLVLGGVFVTMRASVAGTRARLLASVGAAIYVGGLAAALPAIRDLPEGLRWVVFLLAVVWAYDICAYAVGMTVGRHLFEPRLSPRKTWEGVGGGLAGALLAGGLMSLLLDASLWLLLAAAAATAIAAQAGDLFESALKRRAGVKDSGRLVPGHGGILDRIDSLLFAGPVVFAFATFSSGPG